MYESVFTDEWALLQAGEIQSIQQAVGGLLLSAQEFSQIQQQTAKVRSHVHVPLAYLGHISMQVLFALQENVSTVHQSISDSLDTTEKFKVHVHTVTSFLSPVMCKWKSKERTLVVS